MVWLAPRVLLVCAQKDLSRVLRSIRSTWEHWYLAGESDVRSSYRCEVFATEFEIQGLELDWIGLCWGGDLIWDALKGWQHRALRHSQQSQWMPIKNREKQMFRKNAYRVLLTRARKGMVIFVPKGDAHDKTMSPVEFNTTAQFLERSGATPLSLLERSS